MLWLADYVYGTISTLVAIAGLTFETNPGALTTAGVVVVGAVAIWLAHTLSRLVTMRSWRHLTLSRCRRRGRAPGLVVHSGRRHPGHAGLHPGRPRTVRGEDRVHRG